MQHLLEMCRTALDKSTDLGDSGVVGAAEAAFEKLSSEAAATEASS